MERMKLIEAEKVTEEMEELLYVTSEVVEEEAGEYQIIREGWWIEIPELHLCLHEGEFLTFDEEEQEYLPDFSITIIRETGQDGWLYFEQDCMIVSLANFMSGRMCMEELGDLECILRIPEGKELMEQTQNKSVQNGGQYEI